MPKLQRWIVVKGEWHTIECAMRSDGTMPAKEFLDLLKEGMWEDDPDSESIPDDEQIKDWAKLLDKIRYFAANGEPERKDDVNSLQDGLWEFKVARKRLVFYDTPGDGTFAPKGRIRQRAASAYPESPMWWVPEFDEYLRLANYWPKTDQTADPLDIEEGRKIREEDLEHDR